MSTRDRVQRLRRAVRRRVLARRRPLAALCAGVAVAAGVQAAAAPPPPTVEVMTAARDLPAGHVLGAADLRPLPMPPDAVPEGIVEGDVGSTLAAPVRAGEPITDVRLVGGDLAAAHPDLTTLPVRLPDAGLAGLLDPGDRIDLIATDPQAGGSRVVASDALVLATPPDAEATAATSPPGALVVLAVDPAAVAGLTEASVRWFLSYSFSR
ncbi:MAG: RcpC/CpaB family pilus assembly protein [Nocardioides sp.]